jgi:hypothetical protein
MSLSKMVISKLNLNRIQENLNLIGVFLEKLRRLSQFSKKDFLSDERNPVSILAGISCQKVFLIRLLNIKKSPKH